MGRRSKRIAEIDRKRKAEEKVQEQHRLRESALELKTRSAGFAKSKPSAALKKSIKEKLKEQEILAKFGTRYSLDSAFAPARKTAHSLITKKSVNYTGEMAVREQKAKEQAALLKARVGFVGNKMGLQYLTDSDLEDERKGLLRRRS